jgi:hypothetical protein
VAVRGGGEAIIFVLFEHQSRFDAWLPFRLLEYQVRIWGKWRAEHPRALRLPAILPFVLHHGRAEWSGSREFSELLDLDSADREALASHLVRFEFLLDDLNRCTDEEIQRRRMAASARLALLALARARFARDFVEHLARAAGVLRETLATPGGEADLRRILGYVLAIRDRAEYDELCRRIADIGESGLESNMTTIAQWLREEGRKEGRQEGRQEGREEGELRGRRELLIIQAEKRFGPLANDARSRIEGADAPTVQRWALRLLDARSIGELFTG